MTSQQYRDAIAQRANLFPPRPVPVGHRKMQGAMLRSADRKLAAMIAEYEKTNTPA